MIEIKIPKEIKDYKEKAFLNLTWRQLISSVSAAAIGFFYYRYAKLMIGDELAADTLLLILAPILLIGFGKYNGLPFEIVLKEYFLWMFNPQKRYFIQKDACYSFMEASKKQMSAKGNEKKPYENKNSKNKQSRNRQSK